MASIAVLSVAGPEAGDVAEALRGIAAGLGMPAWELLRIAEVAAGSSEPRGIARRYGTPYSGGATKLPR